jgi:hypothetical protein
MILYLSSVKKETEICVGEKSTFPLRVKEFMQSINQDCFILHGGVATLASNRVVFVRRITNRHGLAIMPTSKRHLRKRLEVYYSLISLQVTEGEASADGIVQMLFGYSISFSLSEARDLVV